ncbi:PRD domain-containing protein [Lactobacillus sp. ESL0701]|uniref:PRD domain-containing protein n=1 Tax=Lactobacillus sp. ESL0701 TaxID=2983217 RepID=UPI0023F889AB|nr:PRD domain-containing protein [Lactobacillus sp. ESL0701]MDF7673020.1 PRD domain-containing protein [Lactobacillus sp. ESL0701]
MFKIVQVLNNNVAVVHDNYDKQEIVMGRGLAFQKKKGDIIFDTNVAKIFALQDSHTVSDLTTLLANIPLDFITESYDLIRRAQEKYDFQVETYINVTLTTHLFATYERIQRHEEIINYLPDLSPNYPLAYQIAKDFMTYFQKDLSINFPSYEKKSIALHFINAHIDQPEHKSYYPNPSSQVVAIVEKALEQNHLVRNSKNNGDFDRLLIHLKYFVARLHDPQNKELIVSQKMIAEIKAEYVHAWAIVEVITEQIRQQLSVSLSMTEKMYLTIHIERLLQEEKDDIRI